jgi:O-antigen/teichoic acid export membrane protein
VSRLAGVGVSYWVSGFRPRLSLARFSRIWSFSQWNILAGIGSYLYLGAGRFVIGGRDSAAVLGAYSVGDEIASMPTTELLAPLGRVMFPAFAGAKHDTVELLRLATLALSIQALIAIPASVGVALVARDAIPLLLGPKWLMAVPFAQIIALANITVSLGHSAVYMMTALGRIRTLCIYQWSRVMTMVALVVVIFPAADAEGVALARLATGFVGLIVLQSLAGRALPGFVGPTMLRQIWRPLLGSAVMALAVLGAARLLDDAAPISRLAASVGIGAVTYGLTTLVLWRAFGSPPGAETYILEKLKLAQQRRHRPPG